MLHLTNLVMIGVLLLNLAGLSLLVHRFCGSWLLARTAAPLAVAIPFFAEHFWGFGSLGWLIPVTTAISVVQIFRRWPVFTAHRHIEFAFHAAFGYALAWRYSFPDIYASSEKITDLTFVANYMHGDRLPPVDRWLPPYPFDMYYSLQHYGAALLGRLLHAPPGAAYNLAFCVLVAAVATAGAGTAWLLVRRRGPAMLLAAGLLFGGTGVAPIIRLVNAHPPLYGSTRFIGRYLAPESATLPFGKWLLHADHSSGQATLDLPVELFSYLVALGDYHPPLGGYLLLMLGLLSIAWIETTQVPDRSRTAAHVILAATVPLSVACNTWDSPLQALLVGAYLIWRTLSRQPVDWRASAAGGVAATLLISPFLVRFVPQASHLHNALRLVPAGLHTPPVAGLFVFYPLLAVLALNLMCGERTKLSWFFCALWIALLAASEFLFVDDLYTGKFERFNTALKWWAWIYSGAILTVGAMNLRSRSRVCRWGTSAVLVLISAFAVELGGHLVLGRSPHAGQLDGSALLREDSTQRAILAFLQRQPPGIVLQRLPEYAYITAPSLAIFSGQTALLGWTGHENNWRGNPPAVNRRADEVAAFYAGDLPDAARWLEQNHVRFVLWLEDENRLPAGTFEKIDLQIRPRYAWNDYSAASGSRAGFWSLSGR